MSKTSDAAKRNALTVTTPSDREIVLTRVFAAPRRLVWEALTKPEHVKRWWGLRGSTLAVCEIDLRPGGAWRHVVRGPGGKDFVMKGVYREVVPPERLVSTECYEEPSLGNPEWLATLTLEERDGRTTLRNTLLHPTKEARDGHLGSGMEGGAGQSFDRLEELLRAMA